MEVRGITKYNGDILSTVLKGKGVENIDLFLNPTDEYKLDNRLKDSFDLAIELLIAHINNKSLIINIVDSDTDGVNSSAMIYKQIKNIDKNCNIEYIFHNRKAHGLTDDMIKEILPKKPNLVIITDAGTNDVENIKKLYDNYIDIIVIDHHIIEKKSEYGVIINNQLEGCANKDLTGAGMVFRFCQEIDKHLGTHYSDELWEYAMLGLIGDSADLINNEVRYICHKAKENIKSKFILRVLNEKKMKLSTLSYKDLSFSVIPLINAVCRMGTLEEKDILFRALCDIGTDFRITLEKKKLNKETRKYEMKDIEFDLYGYAINICTEVKSRQDSFANKFVKTLNVDNSCDVLVVVSDDENLDGITGLIAGKLVTKYSKPVLLMREIGNNYSGSARGYELRITSIKKWCENTGLFTLAQGHDNAHGIEIPKENLPKLLELSKNSSLSGDIVYDVDFIYENNMPLTDINIIHSNRNIFGGGTVKEPEFAILNMCVDKQTIKLIGASTLNFWCEGIKFTKYKSSQEEYRDIIGNFASHINMSVICTVEINHKDGKVYYNALVSSFEYKPEENVEIYF